MYISGLSLTGIFCTDRSHHHLLKSKPITSATWCTWCSSQTYLCFQKHYELELEKALCHHLTVVEQLRISELCTKRVSSSSFERQLCVFRNLALEKFPAPCFPLLPSFHGFRAHPNQPAGSWSVWKRWQHRVGLSIYFCSITLLILSANFTDLRWNRVAFLKPTLIAVTVTVLPALPH